MTTAVHDPHTYESLRSVLRTVARVRAEFVDSLDRELAPFDITAAQFFILMLVAGGEAHSASQLCKGISYDPGAMTRMLDRLEQKGLVRRAQCPDDRRRTTLEVTAEGRSMIPKLRDAAAKVQSHFLRGFTPGDVRELDGYLQRILANV